MCVKWLHNISAFRHVTNSFTFFSCISSSVSLCVFGGTCIIVINNLKRNISDVCFICPLYNAISNVLWESHWIELDVLSLSLVSQPQNTGGNLCFYHECLLRLPSTKLGPESFSFCLSHKLGLSLSPHFSHSLDELLGAFLFVACAFFVSYLQLPCANLNKFQVA